jgi:hypothetical protein
MVDKNGNEIKVGDMVRFKEDRYTTALAIVQKLIIRKSSDSLWVTVCGGGGTGNRLISSHNAELITELDA